MRESWIHGPSGRKSFVVDVVRSVEVEEAAEVHVECGTEEEASEYACGFARDFGEQLDWEERDREVTGIHDEDVRDG